MQFGVMFLASLPPLQLVELAKRAEDGGFTYFWLNDGDLLFRNPWPIFALVAEKTDRIKIGPMVTNPRTRHLSVTAGLFTTLNEIGNERIVCGLGRGDASVRMIGDRPSTVSEFEEFIRNLRELCAGREVTYHGATLRLESTSPLQLEIWGAGYGPRALEVIGRTCDGFIIQAADPPLIEWCLKWVEDGTRSADRDGKSIRTMVGAPGYVGEDLPHAQDQVRWFGGVVANHIAELVERYGDTIPTELTDLLPSRRGYELAVRGASGHGASPDVSDEMNARLSLVGGVRAHVAKLQELERAGVTHYSLYLNHDRITETMDAYAETIIPQFS